MLPRITIVLLFALAADVAAYTAIGKDDMHVLAQGGPPPMDKCFSGCNMATRPSCSMAHEFINGCAAACPHSEKVKLFGAAGDQPCTMSPSNPQSNGPPSDPCVKSCDLSKQPSCGTARYFIDSCASSCADPVKESLLKSASDQPCTFASVSTPPPTSSHPPSSGSPFPGNGPPPCASGCDLLKRPSCGTARYYIDSCASYCPEKDKEDLLKMADDQPCTFASASTPPPTSSHPPHTSSHPPPGSSYCDTTGPDVNPCCALNSKSDQDSCVHFCDTSVPGAEPCCAKSSKDEQAKCRASKGPLTPTPNSHTTNSHGSNTPTPGPSNGVSGPPPMDDGGSSGPPPMDACFKLCDMSIRPSCTVANNYIKGCASACPQKEKDKLIGGAGDQPCAYHP